MPETRVIDSAGGTALVVREDAQGARSLVRLDDGRELWVDRTVLQRDGEDLRLSVPFSELLPPTGQDRDEMVIPVMEERLQIGRDTVETGTVRIVKRIEEREEIIEQPIVRDDVVIEQVPVNRIVAGPLPARYEGDTLVVPLVEEVLVVEKRLMLREEVRITRQRQVVQGRQPVTVRREHVTVDHVPAAEVRPDGHPQNP